MSPHLDTFRPDLSGTWHQAQDGACRVQAGLRFAHWRLDAEAQAVRRLPLAALSPDELAVLARQHASAGMVQIEAHPEGELAHWLRRTDFQPPTLHPWAGWLMFVAHRQFIEVDAEDAASQVWQRQAVDDLTPEQVWCLAGLDADGHDDGRVLMAAGDARVYLRPRQARWPAGMTPGLSLVDVLLHDPQRALEWLDHEQSLAVMDGRSHARVALSTLPERVGQRLPCTVHTEPGGRLAHVCWGAERGLWRVLEAGEPWPMAGRPPGPT